MNAVFGLVLFLVTSAVGAALWMLEVSLPAKVLLTALFAALLAIVVLLGELAAGRRPYVDLERERVADAILGSQGAFLTSLAFLAGWLVANAAAAALLIALWPSRP